MFIGKLAVLHGQVAGRRGIWRIKRVVQVDVRAIGGQWRVFRKNELAQTQVCNRIRANQQLEGMDILRRRGCCLHTRPRPPGALDLIKTMTNGGKNVGAGAGGGIQSYHVFIDK